MDDYFDDCWTDGLEVADEESEPDPENASTSAGDSLYCDHWEKRGIKVVSEAEFEQLHNHGRIICEDYTGVQPPSYTLEQLRCTTCNAKLIRFRKP